MPKPREHLRLRGVRAMAALVAALALGGGTGAVIVAAGDGAPARAADAGGDAMLRAAQRKLGVPADGRLGPQTQDALRAYQRGQGLTATGRLDGDTLEALGLVATSVQRGEATVVSEAAAGKLAEAASAEPVTTTPSPAVAPEEPVATTTTPAATVTTPVPTTTAPTPAPAPAPEDAATEEDEDPAAGPPVGGALAGISPPVVGGQLHGEGGLSPVPPGRSPKRDPRSEIPSSAGLTPKPPTAAEDAPISPQLRARLDRIAACESGGDPGAVSRTGRYRGKYQFSRSTWRELGGKGDPAAASEAEQDRLAAALYRRSGPSPWPVCGRA
ncbi:MAG: transglycosylase family protein [Solirubrobacteraceae bacterium]|nr:transglycosylase family protein [Solirubrobacteraceae bacterium]